MRRWLNPAPNKMLPNVQTDAGTGTVTGVVKAVRLTIFFSINAVLTFGNAPATNTFSIFTVAVAADNAHFPIPSMDWCEKLYRLPKH